MGRLLMIKVDVERIQGMEFETYAGLNSLRVIWIENCGKNTDKNADMTSSLSKGHRHCRLIDF